MQPFSSIPTAIVLKSDLSMQLFRKKKIASRTHPVNTRRPKNVFKTSLGRYGCLKDVSETSCVHWARPL